MDPREAPFMYRRAGLVGTAALLFAACSNSVSIPVAAPYDLAGQYAGTATDSVFGSGTATTTLAESGATLSGTVTLVSTSGATATQNVTWAIGSGYTLSGTTTTTGTSGACTFASSGQYSTTTYAITGSYSATNGCSGETGTFALTQQCTNPVAAPAAERRILRRPTSC